MYPKIGEPIGVEFTERRLSELATSIATQAPNLPVAGQCLHSPGGIDCDVCKDAPPDFLSFGMRVFTPAKPIFLRQGLSECLYFFVMHEYVTTPCTKTGVMIAYPFEISSPILDNTELDAGLPKTGQIVSALRNSEYKIKAHPSCGLHFHVGVKSGMTLKIAKKASTLVMLLESSLFSAIVPYDRLIDHYFMPIVTRSLFANDAVIEPAGRFYEVGSQEFYDHFPAPLSSIKPAKWNDRNPNRWYLTLIYIWKVDSMQKLAKGLRTELGAKSSLEFCIREGSGIPIGLMPQDELPETFEGTPSTLEFRYPLMSFDIDFVRSWAEIVCKVMQISTTDAPAFSQVAADLLQELQREDPKPGELGKWAQLLTVLGLGHQIAYWQAEIRRFTFDDPIRFLGEDGCVLPDRR